MPTHKKRNTFKIYVEMNTQYWIMLAASTTVLIEAVNSTNSSLFDALFKL